MDSVPIFQQIQISHCWLYLYIYIYPIRCVSPIKSPLYHHWLGFFISQFVHVHLGFKSLVYQRFLRYSQNVSR